MLALLASSSAACLGRMKMTQSDSEGGSGVSRLLSRREVGEIAGVHPGTVKEWEFKGKLRAIKINSRVTRYEESEVRRFIQEARCA